MYEDIQRKAEKFFNKFNPELKLYRDFNFIYEKCIYHYKNFMKFHEAFLVDLRERMKKHFLDFLDKNKVELNLDGTKEYEAEQFVTIEINEPIFWEFDSFMLEVRRVIEFLIKILGLIYEREPPDSIEAFFNGLKDNNKPSILCQKIKEEDKFLAEQLAKEWSKWIGEVNKYRTNSVHKSIPNKIPLKIKIVWNSLARIKEPTKFEIEDLRFNGKGIKIYVMETFENLKLFIGLIFVKALLST